MKRILLLTASLIFIYFYFQLSTNKHPKDIIYLEDHQIYSWGINSINAQEAWSKTKGENVKIAILDTGVDVSHPDLKNNIKGTYNAIENNNEVEDGCGHGTLIAGIIASAKNSFGVVGVAPEAELYIVKVLDDNAEGDVVDIVNGIYWCIENNIQIINLSFGISKDIPLLKNAINDARESGIIIVASSGNTSGSAAEYPAAYEEVISISVVDKMNQKTYFAAKGKIDFCAPGTEIISTYLDGTYKECFGASFSTAFATGFIALILQKSIEFNNEFSNVNKDLDLLSQLIQNCMDLGIKGKDEEYGYGKLSMKNNNY